MTAANADRLIASVKAIRPFVPAKDFQLSRDFYADLGFTVRALGDGVAEMSLGRHAFLQQDFHVKEWATNCALHVLVDDLDAWWAHIEALNLPLSYSVRPPLEPQMEPWGLRVAYVFDPCGVLWHFAEESKCFT
jgi:hypothetical protein